MSDFNRGEQFYLRSTDPSIVDTSKDVEHEIRAIRAELFPSETLDADKEKKLDGLTWHAINIAQKAQTLLKDISGVGDYESLGNQEEMIEVFRQKHDVDMYVTAVIVRSLMQRSV